MTQSCGLCEHRTHNSFNSRADNYGLGDSMAWPLLAKLGLSPANLNIAQQGESTLKPKTAKP